MSVYRYIPDVLPRGGEGPTMTQSGCSTYQMESSNSAWNTTLPAILRPLKDIPDDLCYFWESAAGCVGGMGSSSRQAHGV